VAKTPHSQYRSPGFNVWSGDWIPPATAKNPSCHNKTCHSQINKISILKKKYIYIYIYIHKENISKRKESEK